MENWEYHERTPDRQHICYAGVFDAQKREITRDMGHSRRASVAKTDSGIFFDVDLDDNYNDQTFEAVYIGVSQTDKIGGHVDKFWPIHEGPRMVSSGDTLYINIWLLMHPPRHEPEPKSYAGALVLLTLAAMLVGALLGGPDFFYWVFWG